MKLTEQGLEISIYDDPVILAGALNASAALDNVHQETNFLGTGETNRNKMRGWAERLENDFWIIDGEMRTHDFANDFHIEKVATNLTPEELLGALAAYGAALLPSVEESDKESAKRRQDELMADPEIRQQGRRINSAISEVLKAQRGRTAA